METNKPRVTIWSARQLMHQQQLDAISARKSSTEFPWVICRLPAFLKSQSAAQSQEIADGSLALDFMYNATPIDSFTRDGMIYIITIEHPVRHLSDLEPVVVLLYPLEGLRVNASISFPPYVKYVRGLGTRAGFQLFAVKVELHLLYSREKAIHDVFLHELSLVSRKLSG